MAQQALTVQLASSGRFVLGIGLSHQIVIENMFGLSFDKPVRHMREYLSVLMPLLHEGAVSCKGETISSELSLGIEPRIPPPVVIAAPAVIVTPDADIRPDGDVWVVAISTSVEPSAAE